ncbi:tail fiber domain-containing protein [Endozoicomonas sp. SM1973]|uniref:Tail fiber domain-containing protein n=1 Tax=Spartinivicinus marinus TaxID=2994442 RepID=A0A853I6S1_9GAMM|nr:tail fiber domain-containing protein [Spartinivicinus marinus]MCX4030307.1 tail fiber domain-containing protein [Spartinivicinus marinus]NYZ69610.1 tail fiber domain-containing protein [Spartinivicinus marinus]
MKKVVSCFLISLSLLNVNAYSSDSDDETGQTGVECKTFDSLGGCALSDRRIKTDLVALQEPLKKLAKIEAYQYKIPYIDYNTLTLNLKDEIGVVAQDVKAVYPLAVYRDQEKALLGVNYSRLVVPLVAAVNELNKKVERLEKQLEEQKK